MFEVIDWDVMISLVKKHLNRNITKKSSTSRYFEKEGAIWIRSEEYQHLEDIDILSCLEELRKFEGDLYIITDVSYKEDLGPFKVKSTDIYEFIENYWNNFGEYLLYVDLLILNFELKLAWIFHHGGVYSIIDFTS